MRPSPRSSPRVAVLAFVIACPLLLTGCPAMSSPDRTSEPVAQKANWEWPLKFKDHSIGVSCFDASGCRASYGHTLIADYPSTQVQPSSASFGPDYRKRMRAGVIKRNFPDPMELSWRSRDGTQHHARIDIGKIFSDERVLHSVPRGDIPADATSVAAENATPEIIVEVNDRTVRVYMRARIPLTYEQEPGNRYSDYASELILADTFEF